MKALKVIGVILLIIVAIILIVPFFLADNVKVSHSQLIKAQPVTIFNQVNTLSNWANWSPFDDDPKMNVEYTGEKKGVGAKMVWSGSESGSLTIVKSSPYTSIKTALDFGPQGRADGSWEFDETPDGVIVTWTTHIVELDYPMGKWFGLAFEAMLRPTLEKGLTDLKALTEGMPVPPEVSVVDLTPQPTLVIYDSTTLEGMGDMFAKNYGELYQYLEWKGIPMTGVPFAIYHNWDPEGIIRISAGIPVDKMYKGHKNITSFELPAGRAVFASHLGGYNSATTHYAIDEFIHDFDLEPLGYIWESYVISDHSEPDSTKWQTDIYYPLK